MVFTFGTVFSYGIFRDPFSATFGASPLALSVAFSIMLFTFFVGSGVVGIFGVRFPARAVLLTCGLLTALAAPSLYLVDSVWTLTIVLSAYGLALGTYFVLVASIVPRWFERRRGAATGLIFVGNGLGLFLLPPIWQTALAEVGVRRGFLFVVGANAVAFLLAGLVCRRPGWVEQTSATTGDLLDWLSRLGRTPQFQLLFVGIALTFGWYQLFAAYAVDLFSARGMAPGAASAAFGAVGGVSIASRIGSGYVSDRVGVRRSFLASLGVTSSGLLLVLVPARPVLFVGIFLVGIGLGATATLYVPLLMGIYASEMDSAVVGVFNVGIGVAALVMPPLGTASAAFFEGYAISVGVTVTMSVLAIATVARATAGE
mgnify:CR=1 FL=1